MLDILSAFDGVYKEPDFEFLIKSEVQLQALEYDAHNLKVMEIFSQHAEIGLQQASDMIYRLYADTIEGIVLSMGVQLADTEEATPEFSLEVLTLLRACEDGDNLDTVVAAMEDDAEDVIMNLAALFASLGEQDEFYYARRIEDVEPALFTQIKRVSGAATLYAEFQEEQQAIVAAIRSLQQMYPSDVVNTYLKGMEYFPISFSKAVSDLTAELSHVLPDVLARSIYLLTVAANLEITERVTIAMQARETIQPGNQGIMADGIIQRIHNEVTRAQE